MEKEKPFLFIDTNFAPDEALMVEMALRLFDFEIVGLSTVSSTMTAQAAGNNLLGQTRGLYLPIACGEEKNLLDQEIRTLGEDREIFTEIDDYREEDPAYEFLYKTAADCGRLDILMTGPLTNLAKALKKHPDLEDYISHVFILGGTLSGGDVTRHAELNFFTDPLAIDLVLESQIDLFILPLEVSKEVFLKDRLLKDLEGREERLDRILYQMKSLPEEKRSLKAPLLLYMLTTPQAFIFEEKGLRVDRGDYRGRLFEDEKRKKNYLANRVNEEAFYDYLRGIFLK